MVFYLTFSIYYVRFSTLKTSEEQDEDKTRSRIGQHDDQTRTMRTTKNFTRDTDIENTYVLVKTSKFMLVSFDLPYKALFAYHNTQTI